MDEGARVWVADPSDGRVWRPALIHAAHRSPPAVTVEFEDEDSKKAEGDDCAEGADADEKDPPERVVVPLAFKSSAQGKDKRSHAGAPPAATADDAGECVNVLPRNAAGQQDQADLVALPHLHEASILHALRLRYTRHAIYTHIGEILISVNPFEKLPDLYTRTRMRSYSPDAASDPESAAGFGGDGDPHLFAIARAAYVDVARNARNQSILISGESGAGKTEATKIVMKYFALTCGQSTSPPASTASSAGAAAPTTSIETQVLQSNPILESFGNARTVRNDNSSRFGKFIELQFDPRGGLTLRGARIRTYLLEKIRVIQQARHERNFHIFYELLAASTRPLDQQAARDDDEDEAEEVDDAAVSSLLETLCDKQRTWGLRGPEHFRLLNQSECMVRRDGVEDGAQFRRTLRAMEQLGLTSAEISSVLEIVAALLHMGNVEFAETVVRRKNSRNRSVSESDRDSDIVHATTTVKVVRMNPLASDSDDSDSDDETTYDAPVDHFANAAALLGVEPEQLERALTRRWLRTANETLEVTLDVDHAENTRNALAMECYRLLFEWLVGRINDKIRPDARRSPSRGLAREKSSDDSTSSSSSEPEPELSIGLLDIFGFEDMAVNSFEQLCINYANEALQHQFNEYVFASEQRLYREEGILAPTGDAADPNVMSLDDMEFPDNSACLELFERKPLGIFSLTDQECVFPQGNDRALVAKFYTAFASGDALAASSAQQAARGRSRSSSTTVGSHANFVMASALKRSTHFGVAHYAGRVIYTAEGFLAKNKDAFCESAVLLLGQSRNPLIQSLAASSAAAATAKSVAAAASAAKSGRRPAVRRANSSIAATSVGTQFKLQLNELLDIIRATTPHYVRCIKPNDASSRGAFDTRRVVEQLRSGGVLEAVRVARAGFPVRLSHEQFLERYYRVLMGCRAVCHHDYSGTDNDIRGCLDRLTAILVQQQEQDGAVDDVRTVTAGVRLGSSLVFFRRKPFEALEKLRGAVRSSAATTVQTRVRGFLARRQYQSLVRLVLVLQCLYRGHCARLVAHSVRANARATTLQRMARGFIAYRAYSTLKASALLCQSLARMQRARRIVQALREDRAATRMGATWRRWAAQRAFRRMQSAVLALQCALRARVARRELMELKRESRNVAKLQEDNSALKSELAALRAQLAAMKRQQQQQTEVCDELPTLDDVDDAVPRAKEKEQSDDGTEPLEDPETSEQEEDAFDEEEDAFDEEEDETSMSIPSFAFQTPGSDSCEESNNQLLNDCALGAGARLAAVGAAIPLVMEVSETEAARGAKGDDTPATKAAGGGKEVLETGVEFARPEKTPSPLRRRSGSRRRRYSLPDMSSAFGVMSEIWSAADRSDDPAEEDEAGSPRSRDRRHSLDLWLARQEHEEEELLQLREEVRATALAAAAEDEKELVMREYVASQIKAKTLRLQLQPLAMASSCVPRGKDARAAWDFSGAASAAKAQSTKHSRGLQAYFADDAASDEEQDELGDERELPLPTRSASVGLPPLRGALARGEGDEEGRSVVISTAWTPLRPPRAPRALVPRWSKDAQCSECQCAFGLLVRRHHCRQCGYSFCFEHSTRKLRLPHFGYAEPQRVCDRCFEAHLLGLSTRPSGSLDAASGWRRKRREASMAMARAAAEEAEQPRLAVV